MLLTSKDEMLFILRDHLSAAELHILGNIYGSHDYPPTSEVNTSWSFINPKRCCLDVGQAQHLWLSMSHLWSDLASCCTKEALRSPDLTWTSGTPSVRPSTNLLLRGFFWTEAGLASLCTLTIRGCSLPELTQILLSSGPGPENLGLLGNWVDGVRRAWTAGTAAVRNSRNGVGKCLPSPFPVRRKW